MKRTLKIHIDANRVTCGKCEYCEDHGEDIPYARCTFHAFRGPLEWSAGPNRGYQRCAPCLAAEREASDAGV